MELFLLHGNLIPNVGEIRVFFPKVLYPCLGPTVLTLNFGGHWNLFGFFKLRVDGSDFLLDAKPQFWSKRPPLLHDRSWYMYVWLCIKEQEWGSPKGGFPCETQGINTLWLIGLSFETIQNIVFATSTSYSSDPISFYSSTWGKVMIVSNCTYIRYPCQSLW